VTIALPSGPVVIALDHRGAAARPERDDEVVDRPAVRVAAPPSLERLAEQRDVGGPVLLATDTAGADVAETLGGTPVLDTSDGLEAALREAERRAGATGTFVCGDRMARARAQRAGWRAVPHEDCLASDPAALRFVRVAGAIDVTRLDGFVPYGIDHLDGSVDAIGVGDQRTVASAVAQGGEAQLLDGDPPVDDLVRLHVDARDRHTLAELGRFRVVHHRTTLAGVGVAILALGPDESIRDVDVHGAHGHTVALWPRPELLDAANVGVTARPTLQRFPQEVLELVPGLELDPSPLLAGLCGSDATAFQHDVDRYSGAAALDASGTIASRHVDHPDNDRVVDALLADLRAIGYCAWTHSFTHEGRTVRNVLAELPGRGRVVLAAELERRLRELVLDTLRPDREWCARVEKVLGEERLVETGLARLKPHELHRELVGILDIAPWWPWWCLRPVAGWGAQIVLVGCHLDSTAASDGGFDPSTDPAPGADDDASGIATVLAAARRLWGQRNRLTHTVRFAFFNAEEVELVGSVAYASMLKSAGAPVKAVICADMVAYNTDANQVFEVHAGHTNLAVRDLSVPIAQKVAAVAAAQGDLGAAQIHKGTAWPPPGNADRDLYDGAINRSDHASFHQQGYPAVVVSEDFFANLPSEPARDANPNYHRLADTAIDATYGARIACAVSEAARQLAQG
jgi:Peptidase family M28